MRRRITTLAGITISYSSYGGGPPLVLVHGSFSDDETNWAFVKDALATRFSVYAIARRGRGDTDATEHHTLEDEAGDVAALVESIGAPVFLLGHSYGAQCSLAAAALVPERIRKLVLYEPPWPSALTREGIAQLEAIADQGDWDRFATFFFRDLLHVPVEELEQVRNSDLWTPIVRDSKASLGDLRALVRYDFHPERLCTLNCPVLLQVGSESPRDLYVTDALAAVSPNVTIEVLTGQAHEGMTTAPDQYVTSVIKFLL
jgi:pimeloyl-ACP methyl ester carboxylesterase